MRFSNGATRAVGAGGGTGAVMQAEVSRWRGVFIEVRETTHISFSSSHETRILWWVTPIMKNPARHYFLMAASQSPLGMVWGNQKMKIISTL
jgi:hypothetical protein